jgi:hypothetical protein
MAIREVTGVGVKNWQVKPKYIVGTPYVYEIVN